MLSLKLRRFVENNPGLSPQEREYFTALNDALYGNLIMYLDAGLIEGLADDAKVLIWRDQSGQGNHLEAQSSVRAPNYATNEANSLPTVQIRDAQDEWLRKTSGFTELDDFHLFMVVKPVTLNGVNIWFCSFGEESAHPYFLIQESDVLQSPGLWDEAQQGWTEHDMDLGNYFLLECMRYNDGADKYNIGLDGTLGSAGAIAWTTADGGAFALGTKNTASPQNGGDIDIAEVQLYNKYLTGDARLLIVNALKTKYDIS